jgi:hypothetical protein
MITKRFKEAPFTEAVRAFAEMERFAGREKVTLIQI